MKYLIVNADDFGYSPSVNKGIVKAHVDGIVTATSVMVDSIAANDAKDLNAYTNLAVGLHFVPNKNAELRTELERQLEKFISIVGTKPSHVDIHKVRHDETELKDAVIAFAKDYGIPARYSGAAKFIDSFFGPHANGDVSVSQLKKSIDKATNDCNELMCHVGYTDDYLCTHSSYNDMRENELESICSEDVKNYVKDRGLVLSNWAQIKIV
jgi:predicted glycoside hydrolase/deacetylase ChbG (UPF0249 family)